MAYVWEDSVALSALLFSVFSFQWVCRDLIRGAGGKGPAGSFNRFFRQLGLPFSLASLQYCFLYLGQPEVGFVVSNLCLNLPINIGLTGMTYIYYRLRYLASRTPIPQDFELHWSRVYRVVVLHTLVMLILQLTLRTFLWRMLHIISHVCLAFILTVQQVYCDYRIRVKCATALGGPAGLRKLRFVAYTLWLVWPPVFYMRVTRVLFFLEQGGGQDYFHHLSTCHHTVTCVFRTGLCVAVTLLTIYLGSVPKKPPALHEATTPVDTISSANIHMKSVPSIGIVSSINPNCWIDDLSKLGSR